MATDRAKFLTDQKAEYAAKLADNEKAKDDFLADVEKKDRRDNIEPILRELLTEVQDDDLAEQWQTMLEEMVEKRASEDANLTAWNSRIALLAATIAELDRLLGP